MTHKIKRCEHCKTSYSFQASGWGAPETNHPRYCPGCYSLVLNALTDTPRKMDKRFKKVSCTPEDIRLLKVIESNYRKYLRENSGGLELGSMLHTVLTRTPNEETITYGFPTKVASYFEAFKSPRCEQNQKEALEGFYPGIKSHTMTVDKNGKYYTIAWEWDLEKECWGPNPWEI